MADRAIPDQNNIHSLLAVSSTDGFTPVALWADPLTHSLATSGSGGGGGGATGLLPFAYGYVAASYPDSVTEVYVFKLTSGSATIATVTVVYTDATKANISTVTRV